MDISTAGSLDKNFILELYQRAFSKEERKPFSLIERKTAMGEMEMLLIREEHKPIGFAIVAYGDMLVLLDYLVITERWRGQGYGTSALELIQGLYSDRQLIVEVKESPEKYPVEVKESPESCPVEDAGSVSDDIVISDASNADRSHKNFFLENGMCETGIEVFVSGVRRELLCAGATPFSRTDFAQNELLYEKYEQIYKSLYGSNYRNIIKRLK